MELRKEEGMPSDAGMKILARKELPNAGEWQELLESRRLLIRPYLDSVSLTDLGSLECLRTEISFHHSIKMDRPTVDGDGRFDLKTQGIFHPQPWAEVEFFPNTGFAPGGGGVTVRSGILRVWGLTRSALWVIAKIEFDGERGYKDRGYERAKTIEIREVDLPTMLAVAKVSPEKVWMWLGKTIKEWVVSRRKLYDQLLSLESIVTAEENVLSVVKAQQVQA